MSAALIALKRIPAALTSTRSGRDEKKKPATVSHGPWPEPGPLPRAAETWGCRLPKLDMVTEACKKHQKDSGQHEVETFLSMKLAGDLARPFGQSTGRGFSFTRFRIDHPYSSVVMRQRDAFAPWIGPDHTVSLRTLYEIGHLVTHADPICGHLRWEEEYPFLVPTLANLGLYLRFSEDETRRITDLGNEVAPLMAEEAANMHPRLRCALLHKTGCICRDSIVFGSLRSCPRCYTDYAVDMVPNSAPGRPQGRLLVFTTWKCLGDGSRRGGMYWSPHQTSAPPERCYSPAHIHNRFEGHHKCKMDVAEIQQCIASVRDSRREAPPKYTAVVEPGSWVITMDKVG